MIGAIIGDIVGSRFEFNNTNNFNFELFTAECDFTDDTICTVAVADAILNNKTYKDAMLEWCKTFPTHIKYFGSAFRYWIYAPNPLPYESFGNGSAMRVSSVGWLFNSKEKVLEQAKESAEITHNHPEGIKGAQAVALAVYLARKGASKEEVLAEMREFYPIFATPMLGGNKFDVTCEGTLPVCLGIIQHSECFEDALRYAIAIGGDSDTIGAIVGAIAEALWGIPERIKDGALMFLPSNILTVYRQFNNSINGRKT